MHHSWRRSSRQRSSWRRNLAAILLAASSVRPAASQTPAEFYKSHAIEIDISSTAGGGYDGYARLLARHMPKYIPGHPTMVPRNVDGAGGLRLENLLYNTAPKDGSVFGTVYRSTHFEPLFGNPSAQFDASKFTWIGSASNEVSVCVSWHTSGITTFDDVLKRELIVAAGSPGGDAYTFTSIVNAVLGSKMKMVTGYPGGNDMLLAMERGEVAGRCGWSWSSVKASRPAWIADGKINLLLQLALTKHPELPNVPLVLDLAKTNEDRDLIKLVFARQVIAYPFLAPPGVPADRAAALRSAFMETMTDKDFLAEAEKSKLEIMPVSGEQLQKLIAEIYATPAPTVRRAAEVLK